MALIHQNHNFNGTLYSLNHLNHFFIKKRIYDKEYNICVVFDNHCFTDRSQSTTTNSIYEPSQSVRYFCTDRYKDSKNLPFIICKLNQTSRLYNSQDKYGHKHAIVVRFQDYFVFFKLEDPKHLQCDKILKVVSAYRKPNHPFSQNRRAFSFSELFK